MGTEETKAFNVFYLAHTLINYLAGHRILGRKLFSLKLLKMYLHYLLDFNVDLKKSDTIWIPDYLYIP